MYKSIVQNQRKNYEKENRGIIILKMNHFLGKELEEKVEGESQLITTSALEIKESIQSKCHLKKKLPKKFLSKLEINLFLFLGMSDIFSAKRVTPAMQRIKEVQLNSLLTILREAMEHYLECLVNHRDKSIQMLNNMLEGSFSCSLRSKFLKKCFSVQKHYFRRFFKF